MLVNKTAYDLVLLVALKALMIVIVFFKITYDITRAMNLPHICIDIDGTITIMHVDGYEDITLENIKGGKEVGEIINALVDAGFPV